MLTALSVTEVIMGGQWITDLPPELRSWNGHPARNPHLPVGDCCGSTDLSVAHPSQHPWPENLRLAAIPSSPFGWFHCPHPMPGLCLTGFLTAVATLVSVPQLSVVDAGIGGHGIIGCDMRGSRWHRSQWWHRELEWRSWGLAHDHVSTVLIFMKLGENATYWSGVIQVFSYWVQSF